MVDEELYKLELSLCRSLDTNIELTIDQIKSLLEFRKKLAINYFDSKVSEIDKENIRGCFKFANNDLYKLLGIYKCK